MKYYPYGYFCNKYGMWCDDVIEETEGTNDCNGDCEYCPFGQNAYKED